ncbi:MAG: hypothetical protein JSU63_11255 [Phycisphaerales bacterium]|nr:MAG: hypothetical protein JSU63_11255 [Phycisphaerales bacterium]
MRNRLKSTVRAPGYAVAGLLMCAGCGTQVGIAASPSEIYVEVGGTASVNVVAVMDVGSPTTVAVPLTISSSDEAVAVVSGTTVSGVTEGAASLTITDGVYSTSATVHVIAAGTLPSGLVVTPTSISCTPESEDVQLEVFAVMSTGTSEDVTDWASYSSNDTSVALVTAEGVVVCVSEGQTSVTSQYLGFSQVLDVSVDAVPPQALAFSSGILTCEVGELYQTQVLATWEDGTTTDVSLSVVYSSTDTEVAAVSLGEVECLSEGSATIIAEISGVTSLLSVNVQPPAPDPDELVALRFDPQVLDCPLGGAADFTVIAEFGDGSLLEVTGNSQTQYQSSDDDIALVFQGQVLCVQQGQATVQASYGDLVASVSATVR